MASQRDRDGSASALLRRILARYDPSAFDVPPGHPRVRLEVLREGAEPLAWDTVLGADHPVLEAPSRGRPDARLTADLPTWRRIADDVRAGMHAYRAGDLRIRHNLHLAIGVLAATAAAEPGRLEVRCVPTDTGPLSTLQAGAGEPVVMVHGLGATKASFLPTIAALAPRFRTIALDLPGFGDAAKPLRASYDAPFFAAAVLEALDALHIERAHLVGHSLGGRVALEVGLRHRERLQSLILMTPSLAWRRPRPWAPYLRLVRPELGLLQPVPRALVDPLVRRLVPGSSLGWGAVAVDEFLRGFLDPRGRAAFYAAARNIYLEEPSGPDGFWARLDQVTTPSLFIWGRRDRLVPVGFSHHVRAALPRSRHVVLDCGHVPQLERPAELHSAMSTFLAAHRIGGRRPQAGEMITGGAAG